MLMQVTLNGVPTATAATTLAALLQEQGFPAKLATAVNGVFVPEARRTTTPLHPGDQIEALSAMQGG